MLELQINGMNALGHSPQLETEPTKGEQDLENWGSESRNQLYECHLGIPRLQKRLMLKLTLMNQQNKYIVLSKFRNNCLL